MNYEDFKTYLRENIVYYLPKRFRNSKTVINQVNKKNDIVLDGLVVILDSNKTAMPVVYLNDIYKDYKNHQDLDHTLSEVASIIKNNQDYSGMDNFDFKNTDNEIFFELLNKDLNKNLLENVPYVEFLDFVLVFKVLVKNDVNGIQSFMINNQILKDMDLDIDELHSLALKNTENIFPFKFASMIDTLKSIIGNNSDIDFFDDDYEDLFSDNQPKMYVLSNVAGICGASAMLYKNLIEYISDRFNKTLYILPSSIHELIIIPENGEDVRALKRMVGEVNETLDKKDILSNNVYIFNKETKQIELF